MKKNDFYVIFHLDDGSVAFKWIVDHLEPIEDKTLLLEYWLKNPPKPYSVRVDRGLPPKSINHIHIFQGKNNQPVVSMNADGTPHDGLTGEIPKKIFDFVRAALPDWNWPSNRIVESTQSKSSTPSFKILVQQSLFKEKIKQFYSSIM